MLFAQIVEKFPPEVLVQLQKNAEADALAHSITVICAALGGAGISLLGAFVTFYFWAKKKNREDRLGENDLRNLEAKPDAEKKNPTFRHKQERKKTQRP